MDPSSRIDDRLQAAKGEFAAAIASYLGQWSTYQVITFTTEYLGRRFIHSSTIKTLSTGLDVYPRVLFALGHWNVALAKSCQHPSNKIEKLEDIGLPSDLRDLQDSAWVGKSPLLDQDGNAVGPVGLYKAYLGLVRLQSSPEPRNIPADHAEAVSRALGTYMRKMLGKQGRDWYAELDQLEPPLRLLLQGKTLKTKALTNAIPLLANSAGVDVSDLWDTVMAALPR